jgi:urease accessory protein
MRGDRANVPARQAGAGNCVDLTLASDAFYKLGTWFSPAYPVGAFAYSSGIEFAVEAGDIADAVSLKAWTVAVLQSGSAFCDAVFFARAHEAVRLGPPKSLYEVAEFAAAFASCKERQLETCAVGRAFLAATQSAWPCAALDRLVAVWDGPLAYPVVAAAAAAGHRIALRPSLLAFLQAVGANMVSAGIRLIPLGQTEGQRIVADICAVLPAIAEAAEHMPLDEAGSATLRADIAGMRHETQHTRLFRS